MRGAWAEAAAWGREAAGDAGAQGTEASAQARNNRYVESEAKWPLAVRTLSVRTRELVSRRRVRGQPC